VHPEEHTLGPNEKLIDIIRKESDPPFITLPAFSKDGKVRYGNGEAVASNMNSRLLTGTFFRVKDIREMRLSLREVLREARYAPSPAGAYRTDGSMYTLPGYLAERKDATNLMKVFLSSNTADTRVNEKISATASQLGI
jgi:hypothetical protein